MNLKETVLFTCGTQSSVNCEEETNYTLIYGSSSTKNIGKDIPYMLPYNEDILNIQRKQTRREQ